MTESTNTGLQFRLFGSFRATRAGVPLPGLHLREGERLLAYLILHHGTPITYRTLANLFWPSEARSESGDFPSTRQAIYTLRQHLGDNAVALSKVGKGVVRLDLKTINCDLSSFDQLAASHDLVSINQALILAEAPLLEGWSEPWAVEARQRRSRVAQRLREYLLFQEPPNRAPLTLEPPGGAVPIDSHFYIERSADNEFTQALKRHDSIVLIKGPRQIGKTSLLARGLESVRRVGGRVVLTDIQSLPESCLASPDVFFRYLARTLALDLDLPFHPEDDWPVDLPPQTNFDIFLQRRVLVADAPPVVWALDETDRLLSCPFAVDIFGLFRSWYNRRVLKHGSVWSRLTLAIAYATEAHLFIQDINQSPFNVGTRVTLLDFDRTQMSELNERYGAPLSSDSSLERLYALTAGHPYLTRCSFDAFVGHNILLEHLETEGSRDEGPFGDHLRRLLSSIQLRPGLVESLQAILRGESQPSLDHFYRLRSAGILKGEAMSEAQLRCSLYADYFTHHLTT